MVASEVRKLAERSQAAAAEIGTLSADTVKVGAGSRRNAGSKLVPDIKKTAELVDEITAACREQDVGSAQINQAIQQLDKVTQQNASASEQMSATSEELAAQAEQLQQTIAYFRIDGAGGSPESTIDRAAKQLRAKAAATAKAAAPKKGLPAKPSTAPAKPARGGFSSRWRKVTTTRMTNSVGPVDGAAVPLRRTGAVAYALSERPRGTHWIAASFGAWLPSVQYSGEFAAADRELIQKS